MWRWPATDFARDLPRMPVLHERMQKYLLTQTFLMSQSVLCNRFHELPQRTARWLLILQSRSKADPLPVTQEFLSQMLGVHRPSVTLALQSLSEAGLIRSEGRGLIRILDADALQETACECVRQVTEFNRAVTGNEDASFSPD
jgi:CRP-like cAMP-binding protein